MYAWKSATASGSSSTPSSSGRRGHGQLAGVAELRTSELPILGEQPSRLALTRDDAAHSQLVEHEPAEYLGLAPCTGRGEIRRREPGERLAEFATEFFLGDE